MNAHYMNKNPELSAAIGRYWNEHIHDLEIATHPVGSAEFFHELDTYRFDKLRYLPQLINFERFKGQQVLEVGCGVGIDLVHFARAGSRVTGIDLSETAVSLARQNFQNHNLAGHFHRMNGEAMSFADASFDVVYAHGVLQYTADPQAMMADIHRVLRPGGQAIFMVYNRISWLNALSKLMNVGLEHEDAPVLRKYTIGEYRRMLRPFARHQIIPERFPIKTKLHHGLKAILFNNLFVGLFNLLPKVMVRPLGWHLMAFAYK
jgi:ubiquinone/menaquinone biosynthesis C-methylase UbiE